MNHWDYLVLIVVCICVLVLAVRLGQVESKLDALLRPQEKVTRLNDPKWPKPL